MKAFLLARVDGGVEILYAKDDDIRPAEAHIAKWHPKRQAEVSMVLGHLDGELPGDRTFRGAWAANGKTIAVDMPRAREIWRSKMRLARAPKLAALDIEQLRGRDVEEKKQELRDVTAHPSIDAAATPEDLKSVWPECLK